MLLLLAARLAKVPAVNSVSVPCRQQWRTMASGGHGLWTRAPCRSVSLHWGRGGASGLLNPARSLGLAGAARSASTAGSTDDGFSGSKLGRSGPKSNRRCRPRSADRLRNHPCSWFSYLRGAGLPVHAARKVEKIFAYRKVPFPSLKALDYRVLRNQFGVDKRDARTISRLAQSDLRNQHRMRRSAAGSRPKRRGPGPKYRERQARKAAEESQQQEEAAREAAAEQASGDHGADFSSWQGGSQRRPGAAADDDWKQRLRTRLRQAERTRLRREKAQEEAEEAAAA